MSDTSGPRLGPKLSANILLLSAMPNPPPLIDGIRCRLGSIPAEVSASDDEMCVAEGGESEKTLLKNGWNMSPLYIEAKWLRVAPTASVPVCVVLVSDATEL